MRPLNIIHALCSHRVGGLEQAYVNLTWALDALGHRVTAWTPEDMPYLEALPEHVALYPFNPRGFYDFLWVYKTRQYLKKHAVDCVVTHNSRATGVFTKARWGLNIPLIAFSHSYKYKRMKGADKLIVLTRHMKEHFMEKGFPEEEVHIIPNMLMDYPDVLLPPPVCAEEIQIGFIGKLTRDKGIFDLVEALSYLKKEQVKWTLRIAGMGPHETQFKEKIQALGLAQHVYFDGWVKDVRTWLSTIDLVVVPSHHETFGIVILEAQAHGRPVIATGTGGGCEQITHDKNGWLAPIADPVGLSHVIAWALEQRARWPEIIATAYQGAQKYKKENVLPQIQRLLESID